MNSCGQLRRSFPGEFTGASLKPAIDAPVIGCLRPFPGEFTGASLKRAQKQGGIEGIPAFPGEFTGASLKPRFRSEYPAPTPDFPR